MPAAGSLGGPGLPGRVRVMEGQLVSQAVMEQDSFGRFIRDAERKHDRLLDQIGRAMAKNAAQRAPKRTGRLKKSIRPVQIGPREVRIFSDVPYASFQESGTKPHRIHGVKATFDWKGGTFIWNHYKYGPVGSRRKGYKNWTDEHGATINHPGTPAHYFFKRAFEETWPKARLIMREVYRSA